MQNARMEDSNDPTREADVSSESGLLRGTVSVGRYRGRQVNLAAERAPEDAPAPDEFAVNLFIPQFDDDNVDIFRVDTAHAGVHADRLYLPEDDDDRKHDYGVDFFSPEEVRDWLLEDRRWQKFVDRYAENHGLPD